MRLRTRLWHWMLIVVIAALTAVGYRFWSEPRQIYYTRMSHIHPFSSSPDSGVLRISVTIDFIDKLHGGIYFWKVVVIRNDMGLRPDQLKWDGPYDPTPAFWKHTFNEPENLRRAIKGKPVVFALGPFDLEAEPGMYEVHTYLFENDRKTASPILEVGTSQSVRVD
jgi:hypothetical protein